MTIFLTGGLGFIGSHTASVLLKNGIEVVLLDNLCNSQARVHQALEHLSGQKIPFYQGDVRDRAMLETIFSKHSISAVMHFAGLKSIAESAQHPLRYFDNNVSGTITLLDEMKLHNIHQFIFSSSAGVYGDPQYLPYDEAHPTNPVNPYGRTKLQVENILTDLVGSDERWSIACLRYFNPTGAHPSSLIGELPNDSPNNLMPYMTKVAAKKKPFLNIFGCDYETKDGTAERDYIHVMDLAEGHLAALQYIQKNTGIETFNLGTGIPYSVLEMVSAFEVVTGQTISTHFGGRRVGDLPVYFASADKAKTLMRWEAKHTLLQMCESAWSFELHLSKLSLVN